MTKKLLTLIHYSSNFVICMIFNSLLFICTKDSIGCASRLQMEIYRRGTSWQPHKSTRLWGALAEDPTNCPRWCCCALEERDLLAQAQESAFVLLKPMQDLCISLTSLRNSWNKHHRQEWMLLPFARCLENDHYSSRKRSSPGDLFAQPPQSCALQDMALFRKSWWTRLSPCTAPGTHLTASRFLVNIL